MSAYSTISNWLPHGSVKRSPRPAERLEPGLGHRGADGLAVVDDEPEMAPLVGTLAAALGDGEELVAEIEEGHAGHAAAELEGEQPAVEVERGVEVADLERDVIDADEPGGGHISASWRTP